MKMMSQRLHRRRHLHLEEQALDSLEMKTMQSVN